MPYVLYRKLEPSLILSVELWGCCIVLTFVVAYDHIPGAPQLPKMRHGEGVRLHNLVLPNCAVFRDRYCAVSAS